MINHGIQYSTSRPEPVSMTADSVFVASNITPYSKEIEERTVSGFQYNYVQYTKDEYLIQQSANIASLQEELEAAKILLGVD